MLWPHDDHLETRQTNKHISGAKQGHFGKYARKRTILKIFKEAYLLQKRKFRILMNVLTTHVPKRRYATAFAGRFQVIKKYTFNNVRTTQEICT